MFLIKKRRSADAQYGTVTLSNWKKALKVFYKNAVLKYFAISMRKHLYEIFKNTYFEEDLHMAASELTSRSDSLELCFWIALKHSRLSNITKYQPLSNQSFKQNSAYMSPIYLLLYVLVNLGFVCSSLTITAHKKQILFVLGILVKRFNNIA